MVSLSGFKNEIALVNALTVATRAGLLTWQQQIGDCYRAIAGSRTYTLRWLYWYNNKGITIDRQALVVSVDSLSVVIFNGATLKQEAELLLEAVGDQWIAHHQRLRERYLSMLPDHYSTNFQHSSLPKLSLQLLTRLLEATVNGTMVWCQDAQDQNTFTSSLNNEIVSIEFFQPADYDAQPLDRLVAWLYIPGAIASFVCGTEGYSIIEAILSQSVPAFRQSIVSREEAFQAEINLLNSLAASYKR